MLDPEVISRIRNIFLHRRSYGGPGLSPHVGPDVSLRRAAALLGWSGPEMRMAIAGGEVTVTSTPRGGRIRRRELMTKALERWPLEIVEEALGADGAAVLPAANRTAELRVRVARHHIAMLEYEAGRHRTTVSGILARELDGLASAHAEELARAIPGFAAAMRWPEGDGEAGVPW